MLTKFRDIGDTIVDNFRVHLERWEERTNSYLHVKPCEWEWWRRQGFYTELEKRMPKEPRWNWPGGGYAANPAGGILYFAFAGNSVARNSHGITVYLQIENATRLTVRLGSWTEGGPRIRAPLMYEVLGLLEESARQAGDFEIKKAGRFRGGGSAAVAEVTFADGKNYLALDGQGILDMDRTVRRLDRMREIVAEVASRL